MTTTTTKFVTAFDALDRAHVTWLKKVMDMAGMMGDPKGELNMINIINANPFGVKLAKQDALDWPHIHFVLCASYARAVLCGRAYVPSSQ